jgi:hypothetical protein
MKKSRKSKAKQEDNVENLPDDVFVRVAQARQIAKNEIGKMLIATNKNLDLGKMVRPTENK